MIDEMATTAETTTAETETFDLEAAIATYQAEQDQKEAERKEAEERVACERVERQRAELWGYITSALPVEVIAGLGITGPEVIEPYNGHDVSVPFVVDGETWHIMSTSSSTSSRVPRDVRYIARNPNGYSAHSWVIASELLGEILGSIASYRAAREPKRQVNEVAAPDVEVDADFGTGLKSQPMKTWEPQVLGSDGYRTTYLLDVDTGCGSLTQHALTVAQINRAGDVIVSQLFPGRVNRYGDDEGAPKSAVAWHMSGTELRALWPLWHQVTAGKTEKAAEKAADIPF